MATKYITKKKLTFKELKRIVTKSVENVWYNMRRIDPVPGQIEDLTKDLAEALGVQDEDG